MRVQPHTWFSIFIFVFFAFIIWAAIGWPWQARLYPWVVGIPMLILAAFNVITELKNDNRESDPGTVSVDSPGATPSDFQFTKGIDPALARRRTINIFLWIFGFLLGLWLAGFSVTIPVFVFLYLKVASRERWVLSFVLSGIAWLLFWGLFENVLHLPFPEGMIYSWLGL